MGQPLRVAQVLLVEDRLQLCEVREGGAGVFGPGFESALGQGTTVRISFPPELVLEPRLQVAV